MYKDFLGKNREYVEAQLHDKIAEKFKEPEKRIRYQLRENLSITFYFDQNNKVKSVSFAYSEEISPEQAIKEIGYAPADCHKLRETNYRITTPNGTDDMTIYNGPEGTLVSISNFSS